MGGGDWRGDGYGRRDEPYSNPRGFAKFKRDFSHGFTGKHLSHLFDENVDYNQATVTAGILSRVGVVLGGGTGAFVGTMYAINYLGYLK
jgi:hypothetical protein